MFSSVLTGSFLLLSRHSQRCLEVCLLSSGTRLQQEIVLAVSIFVFFCLVCIFDHRCGLYLQIKFFGQRRGSTDGFKRNLHCT